MKNDIICKKYDIFHNAFVAKIKESLQNDEFLMIFH